LLSKDGAVVKHCKTRRTGSNYAHALISAHTKWNYKLERKDYYTADIVCSALKVLQYWSDYSTTRSI